MIDGISGGGGLVRGPFAGRSAATSAADRKEPAQPVQRINPTQRSGAGGLIADMASAPPVNSARVAELRAQVAGGRYPVDPLAIADAMLRLERGKP